MVRAIFVKTIKRTNCCVDLAWLFKEIHHLLWWNRDALKNAHDLSSDEEKKTKPVGESIMVQTEANNAMVGDDGDDYEGYSSRH